MVEQYDCLPVKADRLLSNLYLVGVHVQFLCLLLGTYPPQFKHRRYKTQESVARCRIQRAYKFTFDALSHLLTLGTAEFFFSLVDRSHRPNAPPDALPELRRMPRAGEV
jgi:hypothetical protein